MKEYELSWDKFREQADYFMHMLKDENLTEETKSLINNSLQGMINMWVNPVMHLVITND